jgi:hypothetical protein
MRSAAQALATAAEMVILEGRRAGGSARDGGLRLERFMPWPDAHEPEVLLPLDQPRAARYAIGEWTVPVRRWKRARNRAFALLLDRSVFPPLREVIAVGARSPGQPFMVAPAIREFELPSRLQWFLTLGEGDALTRGVFHLFPPDAEEPRWVIKFARVPGYLEPFDRDRRALDLAMQAGGALAARAPQLLGRFEVEGLAASLETAAVGRRVNLILRAPGNRAGKRRTIEAVAGWLLDVVRATAQSPARGEPERRRLTAEVLPRWRREGATDDLLRGLDAVPAVFEHRDLGSWNVIARDEEFTAVDWESSVRDGFPLWDLLYFLTDALAHLDGDSPLERRAQHAARLHRGELASSATLFAWIRRMVEALELPDESVGRLATLCWLHHGLSHVARGTAARAVETDPAGIPPYLDAIARLWLTDPALGAGWKAWRFG